MYRQISLIMNNFAEFLVSETENKEKNELSSSDSDSDSESFYNVGVQSDSDSESDSFIVVDDECTPDKVSLQDSTTLVYKENSKVENHNETEIKKCLEEENEFANQDEIADEEQSATLITEPSADASKTFCEVTTKKDIIINEYNLDEINPASDSIRVVVQESSEVEHQIERKIEKCSEEEHEFAEQEDESIESPEEQDEIEQEPHEDVSGLENTVAQNCSLYDSSSSDYEYTDEETECANETDSTNVVDKVSETENKKKNELSSSESDSDCESFYNVGLQSDSDRFIVVDDECNPDNVSLQDSTTLVYKESSKVENHIETEIQKCPEEENEFANQDEIADEEKSATVITEPSADASKTFCEVTTKKEIIINEYNLDKINPASDSIRVVDQESSEIEHQIERKIDKCSEEEREFAEQEDASIESPEEQNEIEQKTDENVSGLEKTVAQNCSLYDSSSSDSEYTDEETECANESDSINVVDKESSEVEHQIERKIDKCSEEEREFAEQKDASIESPEEQNEIEQKTHENVSGLEKTVAQNCSLYDSSSSDSEYTDEETECANESDSINVVDKESSEVEHQIERKIDKCSEEEREFAELEDESIESPEEQDVIEQKHHKNVSGLEKKVAQNCSLYDSSSSDSEYTDEETECANESDSINVVDKESSEVEHQIERKIDKCSEEEREFAEQKDASIEIPEEQNEIEQKTHENVSGLEKTVAQNCSLYDSSSSDSEYTDEETECANESDSINVVDKESSEVEHQIERKIDKCSEEEREFAEQKDASIESPEEQNEIEQKTHENVSGLEKTVAQNCSLYDSSSSDSEYTDEETECANESDSINVVDKESSEVEHQIERKIDKCSEEEREFAEQEDASIESPEEQNEIEQKTHENVSGLEKTVAQNCSLYDSSSSDSEYTDEETECANESDSINVVDKESSEVEHQIERKIDKCSEEEREFAELEDESIESPEEQDVIEQKHHKNVSGLEKKVAQNCSLYDSSSSDSEYTDEETECANESDSINVVDKESSEVEHQIEKKIDKCSEEEREFAEQKDASIEIPEEQNEIEQKTHENVSGLEKTVAQNCSLYDSSSSDSEYTDEETECANESDSINVVDKESSEVEHQIERKIDKCSEEEREFAEQKDASIESPEEQNEIEQKTHENVSGLEKTVAQNCSLYDSSSSDSEYTDEETECANESDSINVVDKESSEVEHQIERKIDKCSEEEREFAEQEDASIESPEEQNEIEQKTHENVSGLEKTVAQNCSLYDSSSSDSEYTDEETECANESDSINVVDKESSEVEHQIERKIDKCSEEEREFAELEDESIESPEEQDVIEQKHHKNVSGLEKKVAQNCSLYDSSSSDSEYTDEETECANESDSINVVDKESSEVEHQIERKIDKCSEEDREFAEQKDASIEIPEEQNEIEQKTHENVSGLEKTVAQNCSLYDSSSSDSEYTDEETECASESNSINVVDKESSEVEHQIERKIDKCSEEEREFAKLEDESIESPEEQDVIEQKAHENVSGLEKKVAQNCSLYDSSSSDSQYTIEETECANKTDSINVVDKVSETENKEKNELSSSENDSNSESFYNVGVQSDSDSESDKFIVVDDECNPDNVSLQDSTTLVYKESSKVENHIETEIKKCPEEENEFANQDEIADEEQSATVITEPSADASKTFCEVTTKKEIIINEYNLDEINPASDSIRVVDQESSEVEHQIERKIDKCSEEEREFAEQEDASIESPEEQNEIEQKTHENVSGLEKTVAQNCSLYDSSSSDSEYTDEEIECANESDSKNVVDKVKERQIEYLRQKLILEKLIWPKSTAQAIL